MVGKNYVGRIVLERQKKGFLGHYALDPELHIGFAQFALDQLGVFDVIFEV